MTDRPLELATNALKRYDVELIRVLCTFAIVWYHSRVVGGQVALAGLLVFIFISVYLESDKQKDAVLTIKKKAQRLLLPWLIWFAIYGVVNVAAGKSLIRTENGFLLGVLAGTRIHLWYLPFIFLCLIFYAQLKLVVNRKGVALAGWVLYCASMVSVSYWRPATVAMGYPLAQYAHALPAFFLAWYLSNLDASFKPLTLASLILAGLATTCAIPFVEVGIPYLVAMAGCLILIFGLLDKSFNPIVHHLSQLSFGIYFVHMLVLFVATKILSDLNVHAGVLVPVVVFLVSVLITAFIKSKMPKLAKYSI